MAHDDVNTWIVAVLCAVPAAIVVWTIARRRTPFRVDGRNPPIGPSPTQHQIFQCCIAKVVRELSDRAMTVETKVFSNRANNQLEVLFVVDDETELKPNFASICDEFDRVFRRELLLSFLNSEDVVQVQTMSVRGCGEYNKSHPLE